MPQMAPASWLALFIYFCIIFLLFNSINFYSLIYTPKKAMFFKSNQKLNWKW
uniref:ATP synthase complex subunit 8 n=1 Tax=Aphodius sp. APH01 TaxID=1205671 RepID=A0A0S2MN63_9SCAR|nr:ATP synthase F0 subunit 8 [Aphodius sp. APH01]